jgi:hypothetical protein
MAAAEEGVSIALHLLQVSASVVVISIGHTVVDTSVDAVRAAAAMATVRALGRDTSIRIRYDCDGSSWLVERA